MASFLQFLSEGKIGDVQIGMRLETVEQVWGAPDDRSVKKRPVEILKFSSIELAFRHVPDTQDSQLMSMAIYFSSPERGLPASVVFEGWTPTANTTEAEFRDFLRLDGMEIYSNIDGENKYLVLGSGASIVFAHDHLHSVHFRRAERGAARRQMSVSLPETTLTQLRARAEREKVSLQDLIEKVLSTAS